MSNNSTLAGLNINPLVTALIETQIIAALKSTPEAIDLLVQGALRQPVNEYGKEPDAYARSNGNNMPYLTWLTNETIRGVATKAVKAYVESKKPLIEAYIDAQLADSKLIDKALSTLKINLKVENDD